MDISNRRSLPHDLPSWIDPQKEIFFISVNCAERGRDQLTVANIPERLFETVRHRQEALLWWPHIFLLMPDHVHALVSFPPSDKPLKKIVSKWKEWTSKTLGICWQHDFFEHRLRHEESRREKADYILQNPVRRNLISHPEEWPHIYFADGKRPQFNW